MFEPNNKSVLIASDLSRRQTIKRERNTLIGYQNGKLKINLTIVV